MYPQELPSQEAEELRPAPSQSHQPLVLGVSKSGGVSLILFLLKTLATIKKKREGERVNNCNALNLQESHSATEKAIGIWYSGNEVWFKP